uniref:Uncharacterized protein n=1 Tax=Arundo donax TaxID=35708 RepID=A0A0A9A100_ARUDO
MGAEYAICVGAQGRPSFDFNSRRVGTCSAVLGICGVSKLHSVWRYSRIT